MRAASSNTPTWLALFAIVAGGALGCSPSIGDSCSLSTDCSIMGDRLCDTSMPDGYCTIFDCDVNGCPGDALCVEVHHDSTRFNRRFCLAPCSKPSDCRSGYACVDPADRDAVIIDTNPSHTSVCLP